MTAGKRDNLVTLQRYAASQDEYGEEIHVWSELGTEWAAIYYGKGDERRQLAREQGMQTASFVMLSNATTQGLLVRDRIVFGGDNWDIQGKSPLRRKEIEFTATRAVA